MKLNMSDGNGESKKSKGLSAEEICKFYNVRHELQKPFVVSSTPTNIPKPTQEVAPPPQDETFYTKLQPGKVVNLRKGVSVTDVLANLYNLVYRTQEEKKLHNEISRDFSSEKYHKQKKKHNELLSAFSGGSKVNTKAKKYSIKKIKSNLRLTDWMQTPTTILKMTASLLMLSELSGPGDLPEKIGGLIEKITEGISVAWDMAKLKFDQMKPFAPSVLQIVTIPVMNWLHDKLAGLFGEGAVDKIFKKQQEVDIGYLGEQMVRTLFGEDEAISDDTKKLTSSILPDTTKSVKLTDSQKEYYDRMYNAVYDAAKARGVENPEVIAKLGATQTSLETGYGKHMVGNNAFGIKAKAGMDSVTASTPEFIDGQMVTKKLSFRRYNSQEESAVDYVDFLIENKSYKPVLAAKTIDEAISAQGKSKYASDPAYLTKMKYIDRAMNVTRSTTISPQPLSEPNIDNSLGQKSKENIDLKKEQEHPKSIMFQNNNTTNVMNNTTKQTNIYTLPDTSTTSPYLANIGVR